MYRAQIDPDQLTPALALKLVNDYKHTDRYKMFSLMQGYYEARHDILNRTAASVNTNVNNKLVNNFPGYIVDVNVGYFVGQPVSYMAKQNEEGLDENPDPFLDDLGVVFDENDEQDENTKLSKEASIKGRVYELLYIDEESNPNFIAIEPENLLMIYSTKVHSTPILALRFWDSVDLISGKETLFITAYTDREIIEYESDGKTKCHETKRTKHPFLAVPVVEFPNNDERQGDFEKVLTLIDAYDRAQSNMANDFDNFTDAFLLIRNMSGTEEEDLDGMRQKRVILVDDDGDANWLVKDANDAAHENFKNRLQEDIHRFSLTPNLTDESFSGDVSGVALRYKLWGLEQSAAQKERKFKKALQRRIELLANFWSAKGKNYDFRDVEIVFSRNAPPALKELVEIVTALRNIVSDETLLALLPFIPDPEAEIKKVQKQDAGRVDLDNPPPPPGEFPDDPVETEEME